VSTTLLEGWEVNEDSRGTTVFGNGKAFAVIIQLVNLLSITRLLEFKGKGNLLAFLT
jgi:hypothetical protein